MRKLAVAFAVVLLLATAQIAQAANLQAGWYVKLGGVGFSGFDPSTGREFARGWAVTSPLGTYGPFEVMPPTQPDPLFPQRVVWVPGTALGVPAGTAVYLYGNLDAPLPAPATRLDVAYETNYDSSQMLVQLYVQHSNGLTELLWSEPRSGHHMGNDGVLWPWQSISPTDTVYFAVTAVPEPPSFLVSVLPLFGSLSMGLRRGMRL